MNKRCEHVASRVWRPHPSSASCWSSKGHESGVTCSCYLIYPHCFLSNFRLMKRSVGRVCLSQAHLCISDFSDSRIIEQGVCAELMVPDGRSRRQKRFCLCFVCGSGDCSRVQMSAWPKVCGVVSYFHSKSLWIIYCWQCWLDIVDTTDLIS